MKRIRDIKLGTKLIMGGLFAVLVPMLIVGIISINTASKALIDGGMQTSIRVAQDLALMTELYLDEEMKFVEAMATAPEIEDLADQVVENGIDASMDTLKAVDRFLAKAHGNVGKDYEAFIMTDSKGMLLADNKNGVTREKKINLAGRDYFKAGMAGKPLVGVPVISKVTSQPVMVISVPLKTKSGQFAGVFGVTLKLESLSNKLTNVKVGKTGFPFLVNREGILIVHPKKEFIFKLNMHDMKGMEALTEKMLAHKTGGELYTFKGVDKLAGFAPVPSTGWSVALAQDREEFMAAASQMKTYNSIVGLVVLAIVGVLIFIASLRIIKPINDAVAGLKDISEGDGDLTKRLTVGGKDEVGILSSAFNTFIDKLHAMISDITQGVETLSSSSTELASIADEMTSDASHTSDKAGTVAAAAEEMTTNMNSVSAAMEQSSTNINTVASAAEEMSATINEIAGNAEKAREISGNAVAKVDDSTGKMNELGSAAQAIGQVVETITDISEQVNLLSLNATIEAARAGEAGKGFAVVANEIKDLANQTSKASMDIKSKIDNIQESSAGTLASMGEISQVIAEVNEIVSTIAAAVEEQSSATREIAENISQASTGIKAVNQNVNQSSIVADEITKDITGVNQAATQMSDRSGQVQLSAEDLSKLASQLDDMVGRFKI